jgi:3-isopropylmalate/(R)-2-methylmalate dehydratase small subunit
VGKYDDLIGGEDSLLAITGQAWVFGDHVARRQLLGDEHLSKTPADASAFALAGLDPEFAHKFVAGDFIVAGLDFARDATQRALPAALKALGVAAIIARSFGDRFARSALHIGLPTLVVEETAAIKHGDRLRVDIEAHIVANLSSGDRYVVRNLDDSTLNILRAGSLAAYTRAPNARPVR